MRIEMTNKRHVGVANVLPENVAQWEAAGWVAKPKPKTRTTKKETEQ